jgi:membrane-associated phospholipid phosphatase
MVREARISFPSTQATLAFYAASFCVWYLNSSIARRGNMLKPVVSVVLVILAILESYSLIQSYHNHWEDVFVGCLLGCATGMLSVSINLNN